MVDSGSAQGGDLRQRQSAQQPSPDMPSGESSRGSRELKMCRICLEEQEERRPPRGASGAVGKQMIAPCLCKWSQRWVHRDCLDEWRATERGRAFSHCNTCSFKFRTKKIKEKAGFGTIWKFRLLTLRDVACMLAFIHGVRDVACAWTRCSTDLLGIGMLASAKARVSDCLRR